MVAPTGAHDEPFGCLAAAMGPQHGHGAGIKVDPATGSCRLDGAHHDAPTPTSCTDWRTVSVAASKSMSAHRSPHTSERRSPVIDAVRINGP
ncbi:MAG TPA: hypothetical protein VE466_12850 [Acidimicrobiales bacterium]|nr:hypothetical protein [Acidimicrobiales bacterium]